MHKHIVVLFYKLFLKDPLTKLLLAVSSLDQQFRNLCYHQTEEAEEAIK